MFQDEARFGRINIRGCVGLQWASGLLSVPGGSGIYIRIRCREPVDGVMDSLILPEVNTAAFELFLEEIATRHADEFVLMFMDGAGWHTTKTDCAKEYASCIFAALQSN